VGARWYYVCAFKGLCREASIEDYRAPTLALREGKKAILRGYDQFAFDSAAIQPRLNDNNVAFLDTVAGYLARRHLTHLGITGFYRESEEGIRAGFYENIGVARAAQTRRALVERGIPEERISLDYGLDLDERLTEPLRFELYSPSPRQPEAYERTSFTFTNMTFSDANFAFDSDEFRPGESFLYYADSVKTYLEAHKDKRLVIIGHTDSKGTDEYNYDLGLRRAQSAMRYFRELGVRAEIKTESQGKRRPAASNKTEEGRQKNRRVNFRIE
jgi:OOP family OmpA-OmpF porin